MDNLTCLKVCGKSDIEVLVDGSIEAKWNGAMWPAIALEKHSEYYALHASAYFNVSVSPFLGYNLNVFHG